MPDDYEDEPEDLDTPPPFFPYDGEDADREPVDMGEPVEVQVEAVLAAEHAGNVQQFVLLSDGDRKLPIQIGGFEAAAITLVLEGKKTDRPMTHDLTKTLVDRLGGELVRVVIDDLWNTTYYAKLFLMHDGEEVIVDSRPSDSIALALRFDAPIFVSEAILAQADE
ncbi:MAG: bifunctional nuclease family protein [Chthonomonas sp.]|nr:bifunctional nuclease family protein [Chthonomonas sp.]